VHYPADAGCDNVRSALSRVWWNTCEELKKSGVKLSSGVVCWQNTTECYHYDAEKQLHWFGVEVNSVRDAAWLGVTTDGRVLCGEGTP
jgi:hypothetical protein